MTTKTTQYVIRFKDRWLNDYASAKDGAVFASGEAEARRWKTIRGAQAWLNTYTSMRGDVVPVNVYERTGRVLGVSTGDIELWERAMERERNNSSALLDINN